MNQRQTIKDIRKNSTFRYKNQLWKVTEVYNYSWDDGSKSTEFKIKSQIGSVLYLEIEQNDDDKTVCRMWTDIPYKDLSLKGRKQESPSERISFNGKSFPKKINHNGKELFYFDQSSGSCSYGFSRERVDSLTYATEDKIYYISLEIWEDEKELCSGVLIDESNISQIKEGKKSVSSLGFVQAIGRNISLVVIGFFVFLFTMINTCSPSFSSNSDDPYYRNDSTRVNKSNRNYYRNRNSRGYGK